MILYRPRLCYVWFELLTIGEELHTKRKLALESIDLEPFFFETGDKLFELLSLLLISKRFLKHGVDMGLAIKAQF